MQRCGKKEPNPKSAWLPDVHVRVSERANECIVLPDVLFRTEPPQPPPPKEKKAGSHFHRKSGFFS